MTANIYRCAGALLTTLGLGAILAGCGANGGAPVTTTPITVTPPTTPITVTLPILPKAQSFADDAFNIRFTLSQQADGFHVNATLNGKTNIDHGDYAAMTVGPFSQPLAAVKGITSGTGNTTIHPFYLLTQTPDSTGSIRLNYGTIQTVVTDTAASGNFTVQGYVDLPVALGTDAYMAVIPAGVIVATSAVKAPVLFNPATHAVTTLLAMPNLINNITANKLGFAYVRSGGPTNSDVFVYDATATKVSAIAAPVADGDGVNAMIYNGNANILNWTICAQSALVTGGCNSGQGPGVAALSSAGAILVGDAVEPDGISLTRTIDAADYSNPNVVLTRSQQVETVQNNTDDNQIGILTTGIALPGIAGGSATLPLAVATDNTEYFSSTASKAFATVNKTTGGVTGPGNAVNGSTIQSMSGDEHRNIVISQANGVFTLIGHDDAGIASGSATSATFLLGDINSFSFSTNIVKPAIVVGNTPTTLGLSRQINSAAAGPAH